MNVTNIEGHKIPCDGLTQKGQPCLFHAVGRLGTHRLCTIHLKRLLANKPVDTDAGQLVFVDREEETA